MYTVQLEINWNDRLAIGKKYGEKGAKVRKSLRKPWKLEYQGIILAYTAENSK